MAKVSSKSKIGNIVLWIIGILLVVGLLGTSASLFKASVTEVKATAYAVGTINERGVVEESEASIYTKDFINAKGLQCKLEEDAEITYKVYFYDEDEAFISATDELSEDLKDSDIPATAEYAKIVITPVKDEDGKVGFFEKYTYADQLTVTSYKLSNATKTDSSTSSKDA